MDQKKIILDFIKAQRHMVIATMGKDGNPEAALVGFGEAEDLSLIFGTYTNTRKYQNLSANPAIALVIGTGVESTTVQYEGIASELTGGELEKYKQLYFSKTPSAKEYENAKGEIYLKVVPKWIRYTNYSKEQIEVFEVVL